MLVLQTPAAFADHIGEQLGPTAWRSLGQDEVNSFADLSGDDQWIHVDAERAARERPDGRTIVHGLFVLSLIPAWQRELFHIERRGAGLNYGYDRVRFTAPVPVGAPIRLMQTVAEICPHRHGTRISLTSTIEVDTPGQTALVADCIILISEP